MGRAMESEHSISHTNGFAFDSSSSFNDSAKNSALCLSAELQRLKPAGYFNGCFYEKMFENFKGNYPINIR